MVVVIKITQVIKCGLHPLPLGDDAVYTYVYLANSSTTGPSSCLVHWDTPSSLAVQEGDTFMEILAAHTAAAATTEGGYSRNP